MSALYQPICLHPKGLQLAPWRPVCPHDWLPCVERQLLGVRVDIKGVLSSVEELGIRLHNFIETWKTTTL